jgi:hypothetical protein
LFIGAASSIIPSDASLLCSPKDAIYSFSGFDWCDYIDLLFTERISSGALSSD